MQFFVYYIYIYTHTHTHLRVCCCFSHVRLFVTPWTRTCQAPLIMGFSRQEYWSRFPCLLPRYLPNSGTEPKSPVSSASQGDSLLLNRFPGGSDGKESACNAGDPGSIPWVRQDPLEKGIATHSRILTWRVPWTEEPGGLQFTGLQKDAHD